MNEQKSQVERDEDAIDAALREYHRAGERLALIVATFVAGLLVLLVVIIAAAGASQ